MGEAAIGVLSGVIMPDAEPSGIALFAAELKAQRTRLGWTQAELGDKIGFSGSFVSDVERSERTPRIDFARACDREMGLPGSLERMHALVRNAAYPSFFAPVVPFEREAVRIHGFELGSVPGLLQTESYARALIRATRPHDKDADIERLVAARLERQEIMAKDCPPLLWYVLDESVLRRVVGSQAVMAEQIDRLIMATSGPDTVIQVLTFADGEGVGSDGPISVYEFSEAPSVCYTECNRGGRVIEDHAEVAEMMTKINMIRVSALSPRASVDLMREIRSQLDDQQ
jgi:transcriptional regulator with XRE-family HTH domain